MTAVPWFQRDFPQAVQLPPQVRIECNFDTRLKFPVDPGLGRDEIPLMIRKAPTLIGYFSKRTMKRPDWLEAPGVDEVCSVSRCVSDGPDDWIDQWRHNEMWVYDTPELAWSVVPVEMRGELDLYAYQMFPIQFADGQQRPFEFPPLRVAPLPPSFERLGFDVVSRSCGNAFECSPLSCNHMAEHFAVNRYCLVDDADAAIRLAAEFEARGCEPGPYCVIEVWRQRSDASQ